VNLDGAVSSPPVYRQGGHLYFSLRDGEGGEITCAAYRQTRTFRESLARLVSGDRLSVWGAVRPPDAGHPTVLNLEKVRIDGCAPLFSYENPFCPRCGGRMESLGRGQGMRCKKCRFKQKRAAKDRREHPRELGTGFLEPHPESWRHLYRPCRLPPAALPDESLRFWGGGRPRA
jgi:tRNA(Ile2)-agmatinylcytidine synthase